MMPNVFTRGELFSPKKRIKMSVLAQVFHKCARINSVGHVCVLKKRSTDISRKFLAGTTRSLALLIHNGSISKLAGLLNSDQDPEHPDPCFDKKKFHAKESR